MTDKERIENLEQENHRLRGELKLYKESIYALNKYLVSQAKVIDSLLKENKNESTMSDD